MNNTFSALGCLAALGAGGCAANVDADPSALDQVSSALSAVNSWVMGSYDEVGSGNNTTEHRIGTDNVDQLEVKWVFDASTAGFPVGPVHATPVVGGNKVYFGTSFGQFFSLDRDGELRWAYQARDANPLLQAVFGQQKSAVVGAAVLTKKKGLVIFGDLDGNIYALKRGSGEEVWVKAMNPHPLGGLVGNSMLLVDDTVYIGMSSVENAALGIPGYTCCTHRGFVVALDVATGEEKWRTYTVDEPQALPGAFAPFAMGPSGADVWGQPTYDRETDTLYFGTGQNFSPKLAAAPPFSSDTSDAVFALDASTGEVKWTTQLVQGDVWVAGIPNPNPIDPNTGAPAFPLAKAGFLDLDFGDSLKVYRLADGTKVVGAGQKNGEYQVLDAASGNVLESTPLVQYANNLGGFQNGGAMNEDTIFLHGNDGTDPTTTEGLYSGVVMGVSLDGTQVKWRFDRYLTPISGPITVANDVVYAVSPAEEAATFDPNAAPEWALYGFDAETGDVRLRRTFPGRAMSGAVVSNGLLYVGKGNTAVPEIGMDFDGGLIALGLPDDDE